MGGLAEGEFDRLTIAGDLRLGGVLQVSLVDLGNGYQPQLGDRFEVMTFGSVEGEFLDVSGTRINERLRLDPVFDQGRLELVVVHATWHNFDAPQDVNVDGFITPNDVLRIINELNRSSPRQLPLPTVSLSPPPFFDVNLDQFISPNDVLQVINFMNRRVSGESEGGGSDSIVIAPASSVDSLERFPSHGSVLFADWTGESPHRHDRSARYTMNPGGSALDDFNTRLQPAPVVASQAVPPRITAFETEPVVRWEGGESRTPRAMPTLLLDSQQQSKIEEILSDIAEDVFARYAELGLEDLALESLGVC